MKITWTETLLTLGDVTVVSLRAPDYALADPAYGAPAADLLLSPRLAPQMIGLGLLEAIPAANILALADPDEPMAMAYPVVRRSFPRSSLACRCLAALA